MFTLKKYGEMTGGEVALYPQGGTWVYDRANWCPGDKATTRNHELTSYINNGEENSLGLTFTDLIGILLKQVIFMMLNYLLLKIQIFKQMQF